MLLQNRVSVLDIIILKFISARLNCDCGRNAERTRDTTHDTKTERLTGERWLPTIVTGGRWTDDGDDKERRRRRRRCWRAGGGGGGSGRTAVVQWQRWWRWWPSLSQQLREPQFGRFPGIRAQHTQHVHRMNYPADRVRVFSPQASTSTPPSNHTPTERRVPVRYVRSDVPFCSLRRNNDNSPWPANVLTGRPSSRSRHTVGVTQRGHRVSAAVLEYRNIL